MTPVQRSPSDANGPPSATSDGLQAAVGAHLHELERRTTQRPRDPTFDILKGISILEVMAHHTLSTSMRKFAAEHDPAWWTMATLSRILHFAVPAFLLVSAILLARSVASNAQPDWRRFFARRAQRTLVPYVVWSAIYTAFRLLLLRAESDMEPAVLALPGVGSLTAPILLTPERLWTNLLWGKAYFHVYFMVVLLQFSAVFPLLFAAMRGLRLGFWSVLALGAALQLAAFQAQYHLWRLSYPGSTALWYCMPVMAGMWLGLNWDKWEQVWRQGRWFFGGLAASGLALYLPLAIMHYLDRPFSSLAYNCGIAVYCIGIALLLLGLSRRLTATPWLRRVLQGIGDRSIAYFLIHPIVLFLLGGPRVTVVIARLPVPMVWLGLLMLALTWALSSASKRLKLDGVLFGR
jgi:peptidoglycan/LPS O-acetylase OafA/YrhL